LPSQALKGPPASIGPASAPPLPASGAIASSVAPPAAPPEPVELVLSGVDPADEPPVPTATPVVEPCVTDPAIPVVTLRPPAPTAVHGGPPPNMSGASPEHASVAERPINIKNSLFLLTVTANFEGSISPRAAPPHQYVHPFASKKIAVKKHL
jgi:hypothetical protein